MVGKNQFHPNFPGLLSDTSILAQCEKKEGGWGEITLSLSLSPYMYGEIYIFAHIYEHVKDKRCSFNDY